MVEVDVSDPEGGGTSIKVALYSTHYSSPIHSSRVHQLSAQARTVKYDR
jgi:hypothetical protein